MQRRLGRRCREESRPDDRPMIEMLEPRARAVARPPDVTRLRNFDEQWHTKLIAAVWKVDKHGHLSPVVLAVDCIKFNIFFFFQAEDGIRDLTVTGVQTCALPI